MHAQAAVALNSPGMYTHAGTCAQVGVAGVEDAMEALRRSARIRQKAATALNYGSSRSHSIFAIALYKSSACAGASTCDAAEGAAKHAHPCVSKGRSPPSG
jgi:hypothetical protein